jgi:ABC-type nitrate/sulfonate/bicarbonate transport system permease component
LLSPYLKAFKAMPRPILARIFAVWFGLGIWSKVALAGVIVLTAFARLLDMIVSTLERHLLRWQAP